jgi:2,3-bisphosphoglycerate-dependent phosphoglycerate mutase
VTVRVSFVRHGQTEWNVHHRLLGWTDLPLNAEGERQARLLGAAVQISRYTDVWSSDLRRASDTARLAGWDATRDVRLREIDFGELEGSTWRELDAGVRADLSAFDGFVAPGGESAEAFVGRVSEFLDGLVPGAHMAVTHGGVIRAALRVCGEAGAFPDHGVVYTVDWTRRTVLDVQTPTV